MAQRRANCLLRLAVIPGEEADHEAAIVRQWMLGTSLASGLVVLLCCRANLESSHHLIAFDTDRPDILGPASVGFHSIIVHMPEAVLCGGVGLPKESVVATLCSDMRYAESIPINLNISVQTTNRQVVGNIGEGSSKVNFINGCRSHLSPFLV